MTKEIKLKALKNRLSVIQERNKKGSVGVIRKLQRQIRNLEV